MGTTAVKPSEQRLPIFAERFHLLRGPMSQASFGQFLGVSAATVGFYENGARLPDAEILQGIAQKCNVSADWLIGSTDVKQPDTTTQAVCSYTGLSEKAVTTLHDSKFQFTYDDPDTVTGIEYETGPTPLREFISRLLEKDPDDLENTCDTVDYISSLSADMLNLTPEEYGKQLVEAEKAIVSAFLRSDYSEKLIFPICGGGYYTPYDEVTPLERYEFRSSQVKDKLLGIIADVYNDMTSAPSAVKHLQEVEEEGQRIKGEAAKSEEFQSMIKAFSDKQKEGAGDNG